jgi:hypothetical protein
MTKLTFTLTRGAGRDPQSIPTATRRLFLQERQKAHEQLAASARTQRRRERELGAVEGLAEALEVLQTEFAD